MYSSLTFLGFIQKFHKGTEIARTSITEATYCMKATVRRLDKSNGDMLIGIMSIVQWVSKDCTVAERERVMKKREH